MKNLTKTIFIPQGSSERFIDFSTLGGQEYFAKNIFMAALCSYTPGYHVAYPEARRHNVIFCRKGRFDYTYDGISGTAKAGDVLIMPAGGCQNFSSGEKIESVFFLLIPDSVWGDPVFRHSKAKDLELIWQLMNKAAAFDIGASSEALRRPLGRLLFALLEEELKSSGGKTKFQLLQNRMHMHPQEDWSVEKMAAFCGVSVPYFFSLCRKYYGISPFQLLKKFRMELAEELLILTEYSVKTIAGMCGYEHPFAFSRSFRQTTGLSPAGFRRAKRLKSPEITGRSHE